MNPVYARALLDKAAREQRGATTIQGTVLEVMDDPTTQAIPLARCHIDGNPPDMVNVVPVAVPANLAQGQRVLIQTDPPAGMFITGTLTGPRAPQKPYTTLVIAAVNSIAPDHDACDYVCDGTDDHVEIQAAIDRCAEVAGRVLLLEGTFYVGVEQLSLPYNVQLAGSGRSVTTVWTVDVGWFIQWGGGELCDMRCHFENGWGWTLEGTQVANCRRVDFTTQGGT